MDPDHARVVLASLFAFEGVGVGDDHIVPVYLFTGNGLPKTKGEREDG